MDNKQLKHHVISAGIALTLLADGQGLAVAQELSTSFEFEDLTGIFTLTEGDTPLSATFSSGQAKSVGNLNLYKTGLNAWMIDQGDTGTITVEPPAQKLTLFLRDENSSVGSVLSVFDASGALIESFSGTDADFTTVDMSATEPANNGIATITLQNNGVGGYTVIDDLTLIAAMAPPPLPPPPPGSELEDPIPDAIEKKGPPIRLKTIVDGLTAPNWGTSAPGIKSRLFVTDQPGIVWSIALRSGNRKIFLDVRDRLVPLGIAGPDTFDERGLLGIAFHPDYRENGLVYTYTSEPVADFSTLPPTANHRSVIIEWKVSKPRKSNSVVDPGSARIVLTIDEPQFNHDAGAINFGPDGMLYIALGDGGGADDEGIGHSDQGNGQDPSNVLGTLLRIDPTGSNSFNGRYGIPEDNPFIGAAPPFGGQTGCADGMCDEIYAYGFRNPFRFSFDKKRGDLYLADVGQNDIEEVNIVTSGNYGWRIKEGSFCFNPNGEEPGFVVDGDCGPPELIDPVAEYDHDEGIAIVGGFVYRGRALRWLRGRYVFGDFSRNFLGNDGRLFYLTKRNVAGRGGRSDIAEFNLATGQMNTGLSVLGFGQDAAGELYLLGNSTGTPFGDTGVVLKLVPANRRHQHDHHH